MSGERTGRIGQALLAGLLSASGWAQADSTLESTVGSEAALLALLASQTEIATRSKMNADFVPGMVSVMNGDELQTSGARNAAEALNRVAGFYVTEGNRGHYVIQVRGVGTTLDGSNAKILLNGVPMNSVVNGQADAVLRIPVEQLERIEVVRGPSSATYGEFAMTAVVNVVTRKDANQVGIKGGNNDYWQADVLAHGGDSNDGDAESDDGNSWYANASGWTRNDTGRQSGRDNFTRHGHGYAPGEVDDEFTGYLALAGGQVNGYQLSLQAIEQELGGYFGRNALPGIDPDPAREQLLGLALAKQWQLLDSTSMSLDLSALETDNRSADYLTIPAGVIGPGGVPITEDRYREDHSVSRQYHADLVFDSQLGSAHSLQWGLGYSDQRVMDSEGKTFVPNGATHYQNANEVLVKESAQREIVSVYVQDQWRLAEGLEVTAGARYDHYDDWGDNVSPRLAAVWRPADAHILKLQYAEAFRPPTLQESDPGEFTYPSPTPIISDLTAEELQSTEFSYIYRQGGRVVRATVFNTRLDDLIELYQNPGDAPTFRNLGQIESWGAELEWEQYLGRDWKLNANVSYTDARDKDSDDPVVGSARWLGNLGLNWDITPAVITGMQLRYVGEREGWGDRVRAGQADNFDDYLTLDATLAWQRALGVSGLTLQAGASNLFDTHYETVPNPPQFPDGLTSEERMAWLAARYQF